MLTKKHFGVYGIVIDNDRILLIHKARGPYTGTLDLVGGTPEPEETSEQTLMREVQEESGVQVMRATHLTDYVYTCVYKDAQDRQVNFTHTARIYRVDAYDAQGFNAAINLEDVHGAGWFVLSELQPEQLSPIAAHALTLI